MIGVAYASGVVHRRFRLVYLLACTSHIHFQTLALSHATSLYQRAGQESNLRRLPCGIGFTVRRYTTNSRPPAHIFSYALGWTLPQLQTWQSEEVATLPHSNNALLIMNFRALPSDVHLGEDYIHVSATFHIARAILTSGHVGYSTRPNV